jgi:hypothetical protein
MKKTKQKDIASYLNLLTSFICEIKQGVKGFSVKKAQILSEKTGIPFEMLMLAKGDKLYKVLVISYVQQMEKEWEK